MPIFQHFTITIAKSSSKNRKIFLDEHIYKKFRRKIPNFLNKNEIIE